MWYVSLRCMHSIMFVVQRSLSSWWFPPKSTNDYSGGRMHVHVFRCVHAARACKCVHGCRLGIYACTHMRKTAIFCEYCINILTHTVKYIAALDVGRTSPWCTHADARHSDTIRAHRRAQSKKQEEDTEAYPQVTIRLLVVYTRCVWHSCV
jgi:hypothetical protein